MQTFEHLCNVQKEDMIRLSNDKKQLVEILEAVEVQKGIVEQKHREELDDLIEKRVKQKTTQEWLEILEGSGMPYAAINDIQGTLNHSHGKSCADV